MAVETSDDMQVDDDFPPVPETTNTQELLPIVGPHDDDVDGNNLM